MTNNELVVIDTKKPTLREEARNQGKLLLAECLEGAKAPIKNYTDAMIPCIIDWLIDKLLGRAA
jgi:hypothetical protein